MIASFDFGILNTDIEKSLTNIIEEFIDILAFSNNHILQKEEIYFVSNTLFSRI